MMNLKEKLMNKTREYIKDNCDSKGMPASNLTEEETLGLKEIKEMTKKKEAVVFKTDKTCHCVLPMRELCQTQFECLPSPIAFRPYSFEVLTLRLVIYIFLIKQINQSPINSFK